MRYLWISLLLIPLAGCTKPGVPVETRYKTITVTKRGPCPDEATYARLKASRPVPLRSQAKPVNPAERVARTAAQLGLYEAEGKWSDQASAVLDRCQVAGETKTESEGVADAP